MHLLECRSLEEMKYALKFSIDMTFIVVERLVFQKLTEPSWMFLED